MNTLTNYRSADGLFVVCAGTHNVNGTSTEYCSSGTEMSSGLAMNLVHKELGLNAVCTR
jgi:hypothetical protein